MAEQAVKALAEASGLLYLPNDEQTAFGAEMQSRYAVLSDPLLSRQDASTLVINHAWAAGYGKTESKHIQAPAMH